MSYLWVSRRRGGRGPPRRERCWRGAARVRTMGRVTRARGGWSGSRFVPHRRVGPNRRPPLRGPGARGPDPRVRWKGSSEGRRWLRDLLDPDRREGGEVGARPGRPNGLLPLEPLCRGANDAGRGLGPCPVAGPVPRPGGIVRIPRTCPRPVGPAPAPSRPPDRPGGVGTLSGASDRPVSGLARRARPARAPADPTLARSICGRRTPRPPGATESREAAGRGDPR